MWELVRLGLLGDVDGLLCDAGGENSPTPGYPFFCLGSSGRIFFAGVAQVCWRPPLLEMFSLLELYQADRTLAHSDER